MEYSLRREPWWNAVKRARSKRARAASQDAAVVTLRLPASRFLQFCRVVLSEAKPTRLGREESTAWARRFAPLPTLRTTKPRNGKKKDRPTPALSLDRTGFALHVTAFYW